MPKKDTETAEVKDKKPRVPATIRLAQQLEEAKAKERVQLSKAVDKARAALDQKMAAVDKAVAAREVAQDAYNAAWKRLNWAESAEVGQPDTLAEQAEG